MAKFNYEVLTYDDRKLIHDDLAEGTASHILAAPGLFEPMPFDVAASPSQRLETVHLLPAPTSRDEIDFLGRTANKDIYDFVQDATDNKEWFFNAMRGLMDEGHNIYPVTPHGNIADIAFWQTGWVNHIEQDDWQDRNSMTISRGVTTIKALDMAASEVVQKLGHVFLSFPRTPSTKELAKRLKDNSDIDVDSLINTNNENMREEVKDWLGFGLASHLGRRAVGRAFHSAWSGKTDKVIRGDDHKPKAIELGEVTRGTISVVKHGLVLPVAMWYDNQDPLLEIGDLTKVSSSRDAIRVQAWQAETLARHLGLPKPAVTLEAQRH